MWVKINISISAENLSLQGKMYALKITYIRKKNIPARKSLWIKIKLCPKKKYPC